MKMYINHKTPTGTPGSYQWFTDHSFTSFEFGGHYQLMGLFCVNHKLLLKSIAT